MDEPTLTYEQIEYLTHLQETQVQYLAYLEVFPQHKNLSKANVNTRASMFHKKINKGLREKFLSTSMDKEELCEIFEKILRKTDTPAREIMGVGKALASFRGYDKVKIDSKVQEDIISQLNLSSKEHALPNKI